MWLNMNGKRMQTGNTSAMIFGVATLVSYISSFMTLEPGDIITTGTPPGVGLGQKPTPIYLKPGDMIHLGIEKLGEQLKEKENPSKGAAAGPDSGARQIGRAKFEVL